MGIVGLWSLSLKGMLKTRQNSKNHKKRWFLSFTENAKLIVLIDFAFLVKRRNLKKHYFSCFHEKWENEVFSDGQPEEDSYVTDSDR
jgi:hypothetical protein